MAASEKMVIGVDADVRKALRELKHLEKMGAKVGKTLSGGFGGGGAGGAGGKVRALGTGLSAATVKADEFSKSLEASNARVVAFGASAGVIMGVERALKSMVASTIKVEKALMDVNVVMNASTKTLEQFGKGMFTVAKNTAQSFDTVAEAATELARQGLGMESTLLRTKDALILTRLTGMNAADSVKSLTAAINSFNKEGVTSAEIVNRMAKVDAAFAVSSEDLAKSISRVGSSAVDAGVGLNQLMALTTAVQQKTARGGAVIGNAFKTIFTRIQRSDVQQKLTDIGVATTDMNGKMLDGVTVLQNLSRSFGNLSKAQQASVGEQVAGVFQINILKAAMSDLVNTNSQYVQGLRVANSATNEAYVRNEQLNQTLDALANRTMANLTQAGANIGGATLEPAIKKLLGGVNTAIEAFGEGGAAEGLGQTVGKGLMAGIGNFISGPGILLAGYALGKLVSNLAKFAKSAFKEFMGLNKATQSRLALQQQIEGILMKEPALIERVKSSESGLLTLEREILATIEAQTLARRKAAAIASPIATRLDKRGVTTGPKGTSAPLGFTGLPGRAAGFIPNFASAGGERAAAAAGGYRAGAIRTMNQPGAGTMMYNSAETVKRFPGMTQSAIMPPKGSPAGAGYKAAFGAAHGFNPYAGSGFVPNFKFVRKDATHTYAPGKRGDVANMDLTLPSKKRDMGIITETGSATTPIRFSQNVMSPKEGVPGLSKMMSTWRGADGRKVGAAQLRVTGIPVVPIFPIAGQNLQGKSGGKGPTKPNNYLQGSLNKYSQRLSKEMFGTTDVRRDFDVDALSRGTMGDIFEEGVRVAVGGARNDDRLAAFDYMGKSYANSKLIGFFNRQGRSANLTSKSKIEAKIGEEAAISGNIPRKMINDDMVGYNKREVLQLFKDEFSALTAAKGKRGKMAMAASGFVPNFSALSSAVGREMSAGVPSSAIRVGSSPALRSSGNPNGLGVYNTVHEPGGLNQGIARSRSMGINPKSHGAAGGFVPNYMMTTPAAMAGLPGVRGVTVLDKSSVKPITKAVDAGLSKPAKEMTDASGKMMMAAMFINMAVSGAASGLGVGQKTQSSINAVSNIGTSAAMGFSMGGPVGAAVGAGLGALTSLGDIQTMLGFNDAQIAADEMKRVSAELKESFGQLGESFKVLDDFESATVAQRIKALKDISDAITEIEETDTTNQTAARLAAGARKRLNIDEILNTSGAGGLPEGGVEELNKQLETALAEVLSANMRKSLPDMLGRLGETNLHGSLDAIGANTKDMLKNFKGSYNTPLQESLLGLEGGTRGLKRIKELVTPLGGNLIDKDADFTDAIKAATLFSSLLKRGGFKDLGTEMFVAATAAETEQEARASGKKPGMIPTAQRGLQRLLFSLFNDPALAGFVNPERVGSEVKGPDKSDKSQTTQAELAFRRRMVREELGNRLVDEKIGSTNVLGNINRSFARRGIQRSADTRMAGITMAGDALISRQGTLQKAAADDKADKAIETQRAKGIAKIVQDEIKMRGTMIKSIEESGAARDKQIDQLEKFSVKYEGLSSKQLEAEMQKLEAIQTGDTTLSTTQKAQLKYLEGLKALEDARAKEEKGTIDEVNEARKSEKENIDLNTEALKKQRIAMEQFQTSVEVFNIRSNARKTANRAAGLKGMREAGILGIGAKEQAEADRVARRAAIREKGVAAANPGAAFREAFAYDEIEAVHEFEEGVVSVAENMQSSFSSAFQSIASGASSAGDAFAGMAQSILDSISQMSFDMASKMMFKSMGFANGGLVKGYQSGGLVTGGSGNKDDVLTKMQGGEFVIRKSAVNKLGVGTLNAINGIPGYAQGGKAPGMGKMLAIGAGAAALGGVLRGGGQSAGPKPLPSQDYGFGRSKYGFLGGPDPDARGADRMSGGGGSASVSLNKAFVYYRRDPKTGALISEAARPTEGRFEVSDRLSLLGRLGEGDPQTARMFEKEQRMSKYQNYLATETQRRKDAVDAVKRKKRGNLIQAYASAAMLIGGAKFMSGGTKPGGPDVIGPGGQTHSAFGGSGGTAYRLSDTETFTQVSRPLNQPGVVGTMQNLGSFNPLTAPPASRLPSGGSTYANGGGTGGGLARVMGGEYIMSPSAVRTHGVNVMSELNRGNLPGYAAGGLVGNQGGAAGTPAGGIGDTTNNVKININVDKSGGTEATAEATEQKSTGQERDDVQETEKNKELGKILQGVVLQEIVKQQRPGGLLQQTGQKTSR